MSTNNKCIFHLLLTRPLHPTSHSQNIRHKKTFYYKTKLKYRGMNVFQSSASVNERNTVFD